MAKVYTKQNFASNPQADIDSMVAIDNGINAIDLKTQNLPNDGNIRSATYIDTGIYSGMTLEPSIKIVADRVLTLAFIYGRVRCANAVPLQSTLFTLPTNYRPTYGQTYMLDCLSGSTTLPVRIIINPSGTVVNHTVIPAGSLLSYSGVSFDLF